MDYQANIVDSIPDEDFDFSIVSEIVPIELKESRVDWLRWRNDYILVFENKDEYYYLHTKFEIKNYEQELETLVALLQPYFIEVIKATMWYEENESSSNIY